MNIDTVDKFSNLHRCNCMNDGTNTGEEFHEVDCKYRLWLYLQYTLNRKDIDKEDENEEHTKS